MPESNTSCSLDPDAGLLDPLRRKELHLGCGEGLAKDGHSLLPLVITHKGDALKVVKMLGVELDVLPEGSRRPAENLNRRAKRS